MSNRNTRLILPFAIFVSMVIGAGCASVPADTDRDPTRIVGEDGRRLETEPVNQNCRLIRPTGSRLAQRVCKSNQEWAKIEAESRAAIGQIQQDQNISTGVDND